MKRSKVSGLGGARNAAFQTSAMTPVDRFSPVSEVVTK
jgi:hypothetical protein